jgi:hypothetical protein
MKKHFKKLAGIYLLSLAISIFGFLVDSDENNNTILMNAFEITTMSFVTFAIISGVIYGVYSLCCLLGNKPIQ